MKKAIFVLVLLVSAGAAARLSAADYWAWVPEAGPDKPATAIFGYGTDFPKGDPIKDSVFVGNFLPVRLFGPTGEIPLAVDGLEAWVFSTAEPLPGGKYFASVENQPSYWTRTATDQVHKPKNEVPNAVSCNQFSYVGKYVFSVGTPAGEDHKKLLGHKLEIVPQSDPSLAEEGKPFKVRVIYDGKPFSKAEINAFPAGMTKDNSSYGFSARTDDEGMVDIIPLKAGVWLAKVIKSDDHADPAVCDKVQYYSSLTFVAKPESSPGAAPSGGTDSPAAAAEPPGDATSGQNTLREAEPRTGGAG